MKKILLVDDNEGDQLLIKEALRTADIDFIFTAALSGEEALSACESNQPDIVILDTQLPKMNGFQTCRKIKEMFGDSTKVIMMTGIIDAVDAGKARESGADDYCVKTSDYSHILEAIKKIIDFENIEINNESN